MFTSYFCKGNSFSSDFFFSFWLNQFHAFSKFELIFYINVPYMKSYFSAHLVTLWNEMIVIHKKWYNFICGYRCPSHFAFGNKQDIIWGKVRCFCFFFKLYIWFFQWNFNCRFQLFFVFKVLMRMLTYFLYIYWTSLMVSKSEEKISKILNITEKVVLFFFTISAPFLII